MSVTTTTGAKLDLGDLDALTNYVRENIRVSSAFVEDYETTSGVVLVLMVPKFMELYDADQRTVEVLMDIQD